eukprot:TRINITY_DN20707_c0_g1_i1.p1 TRINITY_DN20707_c0_g1~~TRINITY_DN20707_c0_g1_i1.p1  ORF type:complete len:379 (-),score=57.12 TRINITY_DN20707_c0_g1_i1:355-1407(-)
MAEARGVTAWQPDPDSDSQASLQVSVLLKDNKVLFVESGSDFVDMLSHMLNEPLGSVAACIADSEEKRAFSHLQESIASLRDPVFVRGKKHKEKFVAKPMKVEGMLSGPDDVVAPETLRGVPHSDVLAAWTDQGPDDGFLLTVRDKNWWAAGFRVPPGGAPEYSAIAWTHNLTDSDDGTYMIGFVPDMELTAMLQQQNPYLQGNRVFLHFFPTYVDVVCQGGTYRQQPFPVAMPLRPGAVYGLRASKRNNSLHVEFREGADGDWMQVTLPKVMPSECSMPVVALHGPNRVFKVADVHFGESLKRRARGREPIFHPVAKFLVDNNLKIYESSSLKAVEIMQKYDVQNTKNL